jgi:hypothetical protein
MTFKIEQDDEIYEIEPNDFVKIVALEDGFPQDFGEIVKKGREVNLPGSVFAGGLPSWVRILGVFGGKVKEEVVIDEKAKKAPTKQKG